MKAPDFTLPDQQGNPRALSDYQGRWLLLFFYPKDDTPGCTKEACALRDGYAEFLKREVAIVGISKDTSRSHQRFIEKYKLPFILLSDRDHQVIEAYGAWGLKKFMGREFEGIRRISVLIDPEGTIAKRYSEVDPTTHATEILRDLETLQAPSS